jgi:hypothetical protein
VPRAGSVVIEHLCRGQHGCVDGDVVEGTGIVVRPRLNSSEVDVRSSRKSGGGTRCRAAGLPIDIEVQRAAGLSASEDEMVPRFVVEAA